VSGDQHEVTVYDRVPATGLLVQWLRVPQARTICAGQLHAYLSRSGWSRGDVVGEGDDAAVERLRGDDAIVVSADAESIGEHIGIIAEHEKRLPSAVLADIAKEPT
jgi:hypothetical protein